ncbi:MAG: hypothetical protein GYA55_02960 [SAR324 cluster bacterium]|uniref:FtsK domain-containing protein n=1 Tax=SAR324 cluster bacterium TaxID=2024889 RepID=A0A7X9FPW5_9DELT|nr:hypothetical protein [SAR324 cluster bacterium]
MSNTASVPAPRFKKQLRKSVHQKSLRKRAADEVKSERRWTHDAWALFYTGLALYLLLACLLYQFKLARLITGEERPVGAIGRVGEYVAWYLSQFMGYCSLAVVLWSCGYALRFWFLTNDSEGSRAHVTILGYVSALIGFFVTTCCLAFLAGGESWGGLIGSYFMRLPIEKLGQVGAGIVAASLFLFCFAIVSSYSVPELIGHLMSLIFKGSLRSGKVLYTGGQVSGRLIKKAHEYVMDRKEPGSHSSDIEPVWEKSFLDDLLSSPKNKKKAKAQDLDADEEDDDEEDAWVEEYDEEDEWDDDEEEDNEEESYSHVVVSRRDFKKEKAQAPRLIAPAFQAADYMFPDVGLLTKSGPSESSEDDNELLAISRQIENKLSDFNVMGRVTEVHPGPVVTLFEFEPAAGVKVGKIASLQDDLAMSLKASSVRIVAPIPRKGTVGIEVPNKHRDIVRLGDLIDSEAFVEAESILTVPIGKDTYGDPVVADIATMPHLLMAGATGTGKSVLINSILLSFLYRATPQELGLILIDPKVLELSVYDGIPHLRVPVVTVPKQAKAVLDWAAREMERRYRLMQRFGVRSIDGYNRLVKGESESERRVLSEDIIRLAEDEIVQEGTVDSISERQQIELNNLSETLQPLPKIVIVIDELADLMLTVGREIEELITRLAQKARAAGLHLIVATQRPSVDVITGLIKANFPARLSFRVASRIDSRTILDCMGAEKLLGKGDMLFMLPGGVSLKRVHGAFVSDTEVKKVIEEIKRNGPPSYDERIMEICEKALSDTEGGKGESSESDYDAFYDKAVELVVEKGQASTSMIQRAFRIGYNRAARIIEMMEREGIIGPMDGIKPRDVLVPNRNKIS